MQENDRTAYTIYRKSKGNLYPSLAGFYCLGGTELNPALQFDMFAAKISTFGTTDHAAGGYVRDDRQRHGEVGRQDDDEQRFSLPRSQIGMQLWSSNISNKQARTSTRI